MGSSSLDINRPTRILNHGHCAFQCWLKTKIKGTKKQQALLCGPQCAALYKSQRVDLPQISHTIGFNESSEAWLESIVPGSRVEARYLGGETFYLGTVVKICKGDVAAANSAPDSEAPPWSVDILFDDGDRDQIRDSSFLRPLASKSSSNVSTAATLSYQYPSDQAVAIKKAIATLASSSLSRIESLPVEVATAKINVLPCCPLMKPVQFKDAAFQPDSECHLTNVDSELRRIASRFPIKARLFDSSLAPDTIGQLRAVVGYSLVASTWVVQTRALEPEVPKYPTEEPKDYKGTTVEYPSQTFAQRTALEKLVAAFAIWNDKRRLTAREAARDAANFRRLDARRDGLLVRFPVTEICRMQCMMQD